MDRTWPDALLDDFRTQGDPPADRVIADLFESGQAAIFGQLMRAPSDAHGPTREQPAMLREYLSSVAISTVTEEEMRTSEELFALYGPEILMVLGLYSTPASYAARRGVQVLHRTAYFQQRTMRRVWETTQFVVDVMTRGGLRPDGVGFRAAQRVRLMHASVRRLLLEDKQRPWDITDLGIPINQEDLAGTLMEFSCVVLEGLARMGIDLEPSQQQAFLRSWCGVGELLGVDGRLLPRTVAEARTLTRAIGARQIAESVEGRQLTAALIKGMQTTMPRHLEGFIASAMRFFLESDTLTGRDVAAILGIPPSDWTKVILVATGGLANLAGNVARREHRVGSVLRRLKVRYVERLLRAELGSHRPTFRIPTYLHELWM